MKFTASSDVWSRGINAVMNAVGTSVSNAILENILVECEDSTVTFLATNLSVTIRCIGEAAVEESGSTVLPAKILGPLVQSLPDEEVVFQQTDKGVTIQCARFKARMKGQEAGLFPPFNQVTEGEKLSMSAETLKEIIRKTQFATSTEKSRYELDGLKFDMAEKKLTCVATDGRRLSLCFTSSDSFPESSVTALIPTKTLQVMNRSLPDEGEVEITIQERKAQFNCGDTTIVSNLLVDNFPQYNSIVPQPGSIQAIVNRSDLSSAVRRAANLASQETSMLVFRLNPGGIEVFGEREEVGGSGHDQIDAEYTGDTFEIRFNHRFVEDVLKVIEEDRVVLTFSESRKPARITAEGKDDYLYVLMPMRPPEEEAS